MRLLSTVLLITYVVSFPLHCEAFSTFQTTRNPYPSLGRVVVSSALCSTSSEEGGESSNKKDDEASRLRARAAEMRESIREMEKSIEGQRKKFTPSEFSIPVPEEKEDIVTGPTLKNKRILVCGANGRVGSMVCRYLLRNFPELKEVVAAVHYVGESSTRGWGRLSYEVGAEDGVGTIGAAWSEDRDATFEYTNEMKDYNLSKLRIIEAELLDPVQCRTITEDVDSVIWCATDFNGNTPRAVAGLNIAFLFRAVAAPTKGRVEIEGLQNVVGGLKVAKQDRLRRDALNGKQSQTNPSSLQGPNDPTSVILLSPSEGAFGNFETPFGEFNALKRQGEDMLRKDFPSLSHAIIQMGKFDDNFVDEGLEIMLDTEKEEVEEEIKKRTRRINRRDVARALSNALIDETIAGKTVEMWTAYRGR